MKASRVSGEGIGKQPAHVRSGAIKKHIVNSDKTDNAPSSASIQGLSHFRELSAALFTWEEVSGPLEMQPGAGLACSWAVLRESIFRFTPPPPIFSLFPDGLPGGSSFSSPSFPFIFSQFCSPHCVFFFSFLLITLPRFLSLSPLL